MSNKRDYSIFYVLFFLFFLGFPNFGWTLPPIAEKAEELFQATLYEDAIPIYQLVLEQNTLDPDEERVITFHFAQALFMSKRYHEASHLLEKHLNNETDIEIPLLISKCYRESKKYAHAINVLKKWETSPKNELRIAFDMGLTYFCWQKNSEASDQFEKVWREGSGTPWHPLAGLYLARTLITQGIYNKPETIISSLNNIINKDDDLWFEINFLMGEIAYKQHQYEEAATYFNSSLPRNNLEKAQWACESLLYLGWCHLKLAETSSHSPDIISQHLDNSEDAFKKILSNTPNEQAQLALGQCYLIRASRLGDKKAYTLAEAVLSDETAFVSIDAQSQALLLRAEAAPTHTERARLYHQLTHETNKTSVYYAEGWYYRGLNDLEEARRLVNTGKVKEANPLFDNAASALEKAYSILRASQPDLANLAMQYVAEAYFYQGTVPKKEKAYSLLDQLDPKHSKVMDVYYLKGYIAANLFYQEGVEEYFDKAETILKTGIKTFVDEKNTPDAALLLGKLYYRKGLFVEAVDILTHLIDHYPQAKQTGEGLFWCARSKRKLSHDRSTYQDLFQRSYTNFPDGPYAAEAYFSVYRYRDYLHGDRLAAKHLQGLGKAFPNSSLTIAAHYLSGLDLKRDRKTPEGKWIRKKNLNAAAEAFKDAEESFDTLYANGAIKDDDMVYFITLRYRSILERALSNLAIAKESQGAKRQIYLEYAEGFLRDLCKNFEDHNNALVSKITQGIDYHPLHEESTYWLAITVSKTQNDRVAEEVLSLMLKKYRSAKITRGYYLSRVWYQLGMIAMRGHDYELALNYFSHAEDTAKGKVLSGDERLDLLIQQSYCHRILDRTDKAMLILSKVINDDAVSALRVKAMYLRAELYEIQGREELARKQLEATAKKGGPWASKAKNKLEENYGYS